jgi:hypothetical protein
MYVTVTCSAPAMVRVVVPRAAVQVIGHRREDG